MDIKSDAELVSLACEGDKQAFNILLERYETMAFYIVWRLVHQEFVVHDLCQEAMLQAFLSLHKLRDPARFKSWFYGITLNICRRWLSQNKYEPISLETLTAENLSAHTCVTEQSLSLDPYEQLEVQELRSLIYQALEVLPVHYRTIAKLFYYEDLSQQEIALQLKLSLPSIKNRLLRARRQLRTYLATLFPEMKLTVIAKEMESSVMMNISLARIVEENGCALLLFLDDKQQRVTPIWLWSEMGASYTPTLRVRQAFWPRTTVHVSSSMDFTLDCIRALGGHITAMHIDTLNGSLYAHFHVNGPTGEQQIRAHLLEALPLAIRLGCPLYANNTFFGPFTVNLAQFSGPLQEQIDAATQDIWKRAWFFTPKIVTAHAPRNLDFADDLAGWQCISLPLQPLNSYIDEHNMYNGKRVLSISFGEDTLQSLHDGTSPMLTISHEGCLADLYRGKQICLSAMVKTEAVEQVFFTINAFDVADPTLRHERKIHEASTREHPLQGTNDWTRQELLIDVPSNAGLITFDIALRGKGKLWVSDVQFETRERVALLKN